MELVEGDDLSRRIARGAIPLDEALPIAPRNEATADLAGRLAVEGVVLLRYNGYKVPLMRNLVKRAIRGGPQTATT